MMTKTWSEHCHSMGEQCRFCEGVECERRWLKFHDAAVRETVIDELCSRILNLDQMNEATVTELIKIFKEEKLYD